MLGRGVEGAGDGRVGGRKPPEVSPVIPPVEVIAFVCLVGWLGVRLRLRFFWSCDGGVLVWGSSIACRYEIDSLMGLGCCCLC